MTSLLPVRRLSARRGLPHRRVVDAVGGVALQNQASLLQDIGMVGRSEAELDVLLDEEEEVRARHRRAADGDHLLLAAGKRACGLLAALAKAMAAAENLSG